MRREQPPPSASSALTRFQKLTLREREVLELVLEGKSSKRIAACLMISVRTVEAHRANIFKRMHVTSFLELAHMLRQSHLPAN
ncbi:MAG TPA: LuxR C-terminal-related transcriptional regulator [Burkholderiaceae bacterium]